MGDLLIKPFTFGSLSYEQTLIWKVRYNNNELGNFLHFSSHLITAWTKQHI